jgi:hypothetical protein
VLSASGDTSTVFGWPGLSLAASAEVRDAQQDFEWAGWKVFVLPDGIKSKLSFFRAVAAIMPLDPPLVGISEGRYSWDALDDSLWEGLHELPERQIAILWPDAARLAARDPETHRDALDVLDHVSRLLADDEATIGTPKQVAVVVGK